MSSDLAEKRLLTVRSASFYLDTSEGALRKMIERGTLPYRCVVRLGARVFLDRQRIDEWIDQAEGVRPEELRR
jgi:excisionase family DNA binding protein